MPMKTKKYRIVSMKKIIDKFYQNKKSFFINQQFLKITQRNQFGNIKIITTKILRYLILKEFKSHLMENIKPPGIL